MDARDLERMAALERRVEQVEAVQAIHALKARYARLADEKYRPDYRRQPEERMREVARQQAECFTADAVWEGGSEFGSSLVGRERLVEWFQRSPWCFAMHYYVSPELDVRGDRATGRWRLWQMALRDDTREAVLLAAVTSEDYERQSDGSWLHSRMRFEQVHMLPIDAGPDPLRATFAAAAPKASA